MTPRPAQKRQKDPPAQPQSSGVPSLSPGTTRVLPMQLQVGDRLADETGEWEVIGRPYTTAGGKTARVPVQRVGQSDTPALRSWGAHERVSVTRTTAEEGNR